MTRMLKLIVMSAIVMTALALSGLPGMAAPKECEPGAPGCKTTTETETVVLTPKNNPRFNQTVEQTTTSTQRGNFNKGTEETLEEEESSSIEGCQNPSGKPQGPTCR
jgi:hypothetical protein